MGITVPQATLPSGINVSNVYMSFANEVIYISPTSNSKNVINSYYNVYKDSTKTLGTNIRIPICVIVDDISVSVYTLLYDNLKQTYPGSTDC
jgi:hypothetical protein